MSLPRCLQAKCPIIPQNNSWDKIMEKSLFTLTPPFRHPKSRNICQSRASIWWDRVGGGFMASLLASPTHPLPGLRTIPAPGRGTFHPDVPVRRPVVGRVPVWVEHHLGPKRSSKTEAMRSSRYPVVGVQVCARCGFGRVREKMAKGNSHIFRPKGSIRRGLSKDRKT